MYNFKELDDYFSEYLESFDTDCISVVISHDGEIVYDCAKVISDKNEYKKYNIGEISQIYLGILILKLIEDGIISADDCIVKYIPEFYHKDIRIIDILTDSIGIDFSGKINYSEIKSSDEYLATVYNLLPTTEIHCEKTTSDFMFRYFILVDLIEKVTKTEINKYANDKLFTPLDLKRTAFSSSALKYNNSLMLSDMNNNFIDDTIFGVYTTTTELLKIGELFTSLNREILSKYTYQYALTESYHDADKKLFRTPLFKSKGDTP